MRTIRSIIIGVLIGFSCMYALTGCASQRPSVTMNVPDDRSSPDPPVLTPEEQEAVVELNRLKQAVRVHPKDPNIHYRIGVLETRLGNWEEARRTFYTVLDLDPEHARAYYQIGFTWEHSGEMYVVAKGRVIMPIQREKAIASYKKAVRLDSNFADAYYRLALLALMSENLDLASQASHELARVEPTTERSVAITKEVYTRHQKQ